ncbi:MAG: universal stress protein [Pirellulales bacterium]|nr:universal stress protein [Pirellulales bacterium]
MTWLPRETVVVPFDFSDDAIAALKTARELVSDPSHLHVIHVLTPLEVADPGVIWEVIDDRDRIEHAAEALEKEMDKVGVGDPAVTKVRIGDPGHEIVQYAEELDAGLIVVASHGQSALMHLLLGSVAERVVRLAHCPVLVLKKPKK